MIEADDIVERAIDWHIRQADMSEGDWLEFVDWLEASPAHARAYDAVALDDRLLEEARRSLATPKPLAVPTPLEARKPLTPPATVYRAPQQRWRWAGGGAIAAALAVMVAVPTLQHGARPYAVETRPGEQRTLRFDDGTIVEMNGGTKLELDHADQRIAKLDAGEAVFHVRHDAARPFTVSSGALTVRDMGTVFNVARAGARLEVQVAEGEVAFQPGANEVRLKPGQALSAREDLRAVSLASVSPDAVGGWRAGRLSFAGAPLATVATALERRYGTPVTLMAGLPDQPFTGMVQLSGSAERDIPHLARLIGAGWRRDGQRWVLSPETPKPSR